MRLKDLRVARLDVCLLTASIVFTACTVTACKPASTALPEKTPPMQVVFETEYPGHAEAVAQTLDGGYFLTGSLCKGNGEWCSWIGGVGENGEGSWSKVLEGQDRSSVTMASDGRLLVCGSQWINSWVGRVMRVDPEGNEEWTWTYRGTEQVGDQRVLISTHFAGVRPTADGGCIVAGDKFYSGWAGDITLPFDGVAFLIVKFDAQGTEEWSQVLEGTVGRQAMGFSVEPMADGGYIAAGYRDEAPYLAKLTAAGETEWSWSSQEQAGGLSGPLFSVCSAPDGGCVAAGYAGSGPYKALLVRLDANGHLVWLKTFGLPENSDTAWAVVPTADGNFLLCGGTDLPESAPGKAIAPQPWLRKVDPSGNELWVKTYTDNPGSFRSVIVTTDGGYAAVGATYSADGEGSPWLVKTDSEGE